MESTEPASVGDSRTSVVGPDKRIEDLIEDHILPKLDAEFLQYFAEHHVPASQQDIPIEQVRAHPQVYQTPCALDTSGHPRVSEDFFTSQDGARIPVRIYHPDPAKHGPGPYPAHLNFHGVASPHSRLATGANTEQGGGFVLGNLDSEGALCLRMREAGVVVIDVAYRLCPGRVSVLYFCFPYCPTASRLANRNCGETTWGKGIEDAWDALSWVRRTVAPEENTTRPV